MTDICHFTYSDIQVGRVFPLCDTFTWEVITNCETEVTCPACLAMLETMEAE